MAMESIIVSRWRRWPCMAKKSFSCFSQINFFLLLSHSGESSNVEQKTFRNEKRWWKFSTLRCLPSRVRLSRRRRVCCSIHYTYSRDRVRLCVIRDHYWNVIYFKGNFLLHNLSFYTKIEMTFLQDLWSRKWFEMRSIAFAILTWSSICWVGQLVRPSRQRHRCASCAS